MPHGIHARLYHKFLVLRIVTILCAVYKYTYLLITYLLTYLLTLLHDVHVCDL